MNESKATNFSVIEFGGALAYVRAVLELINNKASELSDAQKLVYCKYYTAEVEVFLENILATQTEEVRKQIYEVEEKLVIKRPKIDG